MTAIQTREDTDIPDMVTNSPVLTFPYVMGPISGVTPFTYRDGATFLEILEEMREWLNKALVPDINANLDKAFENFKNAIEGAEHKIIENEAEHERLFSELVKALREENSNLADILRGIVDTINNKTGAVDIQRATLSEPFTLAINSTWPNNQPVYFVLQQNAKGGNTVSLPPNVTGPLDVNMLGNGITEFWLFPRADKTGWYVFQQGAAIAGTSNDRTVSRLVSGDTDARKAVDARVSLAVQAEKERVTGELARVDAIAQDNGYVFANFVGNETAGTRLNLFYSPDGKTLFGGKDNPVYAPSDGMSLRDPSIIYRNNRWYVTHTNGDGVNKDIAIISSPTGATGSWSLLAKINVSSISTLNKAWAPEFIEDGEDLYIFFTSITAGNAGSMAYIKALNTELTAWTAPVPLAWTTAPAGTYIDGVPVKNKDGKWYMFYSNGGSIGRGVATSLAGPWTADRTGNWAGWGSGIEGPTILRDGDIFRAYFDRYVENTGIHWSEAPNLDGPWTNPVKVNTAPYTLSAGETLRHGSVRKLKTPIERNKMLAVLTLPVVGGNHTEFSNGDGSVINKGAFVTLVDNKYDENETTNKNRVTYDAATQNFKLNEFCVYAISAAVNLSANGSSTITNVTRGLADICQAENVNIVHARESGGVEDKWIVSVANFKPRYAGEEIKFRMLAEWVGGPTAKLLTRIRFTKIADI